MASNNLKSGQVDHLANLRTHSLSVISSVYSCQCSWNRFATSRGNAPVNGIGSALKLLFAT